MLRSSLAVVFAFFLAVLTSGCPEEEVSNVDFSAQPREGGVPMEVNFSFGASFDVDAVTVLWDFGDGQGSVQANPSHQYAQTGSYRVSLTVDDGTMTYSETKENYIKVLELPTADAGVSRRGAAVGEMVTLDGSGSTGPAGEVLSYEWHLVAWPDSSHVVLDEATTVAPAFTIDGEGDYAILLVVNYGAAFSDASVVYVSTTPNRPPNVDIRIASSDVRLGSVVELDALNTTDAEGDMLTYAWSFIAIPPGSGATLEDAATPRPWFMYDVSGNFEVRLSVYDGFDVSILDKTVSMSNEAPKADAGPSQTVGVRMTVHLDGQGSTDADGDSLTYVWSFQSRPSGSDAVLTNRLTLTPSFEADIHTDNVVDGATVDEPYVVQLVVNDGYLDSEPSTVEISTLNSPPTANAGVDQTKDFGKLVVLDGKRSSDVDGDELSYAWSFLSVPAGSVLDTDAWGSRLTPNPSFYVDAQGTYQIQLIVTDEAGLSSDPDVVIISVNSLPVAQIIDNLGSEKPTLGQEVTLDGGGSYDPDCLVATDEWPCNDLTYRWSITTKPAASVAVLDDATVENPSFTIDQRGDYVVQLIVSDGRLDSIAVTWTISTENSRPVAEISVTTPGPWTVGTTIHLDGTGSSDDGIEIGYHWSLVGLPRGSTTTLTTPTASTALFLIDEPGRYHIQLIVDDGVLQSQPDVAIIETPNLPPVADAGPDQMVMPGALVQLAGGGDDPEGDTLTYEWEFVSWPGTAAPALSSPNLASPSFWMDSGVVGQYELRLRVHDGSATEMGAPDESGYSEWDHVIISTLNPPPVANAGTDRRVDPGTWAQMAGSGFDLEGDPLTYEWRFVSWPGEGAAPELVNSSTATPYFLLTPSVAGQYRLELRVHDGRLTNDGELDASGYSAWDMVVVSTGNLPPVAHAGADQRAEQGALVILDGGESFDIDGDPLTYEWEFVSWPGTSAPALGHANTVGPSFTMDTGVIGEYEIRMRAHDGTLASGGVPDASGYSQWDSVFVRTLISAVAGLVSNQSLVKDSAVQLDGNASIGVNLMYSWSFGLKPFASITKLYTDTSMATVLDDGYTSVVTPAFSADQYGDYEVDLRVSDDGGVYQSDSSTVAVEILPIADAGDNRFVSLGDKVVLAARVNGNPGRNVATALFQWILEGPPGNAAALYRTENDQELLLEAGYTSVAEPHFYPDLIGNYFVELTVEHMGFTSEPDMVIMSANSEKPG